MGKVAAGVLVWVVLLFAAVPAASGQVKGLQNEIIQRMIGIALENNPTLKSQQVLVRESEKLPEPRSAFAMTGMSLSAGASLWDPDTNTFRLVPALTLGASFSIGDPARALNSYNLKKEREGAKQDYEKIRDSIVSDLLSNVREILRLGSQREGLEDLRIYLEDYVDLIETQVRAGVTEPSTDQLWDLKERIIRTEAEIKDVSHQLDMLKIEAAMRLGGDAWAELLQLFEQLDDRF
jgi:outer membrane protein TolC